MFNKQNFCHIASNNRNEVKVGVFVYKTTDDLATVSTSGYFNDKIVDINLHDLIIHEWHNPADRTEVQRNVLCVTERTLDNVGTAVIKSKWEGDIEQNIADLQTYVDNTFVKKSGDTMTGALEIKVASTGGNPEPALKLSSTAGPVSTELSTNGYGVLRVSGQTIVTPSISPRDNNTRDLGEAANHWRKGFVNMLNNGGDLEVPAVSGTIATKADVDLAANSGDQLTNKGVWYAKMYAATVVPTGAEYDGRNYADFSQTDINGDPIIVLYEGQSGAWVQTQTITPPTDYNGYVTITSKIWDIVEQDGQQGGQVLWSHNQKTFTPYPKIVSFEDAALTGTPTAPNLSAGSPNNQIVNKQSLDNALLNHGTGRNVGDIFFTMRTDNALNGSVACDGSIYNTGDFSGAQSIGDLLEDGKVPYVSMADYATALAADGSVGVFGWDGAGNTSFRVPSLNDIFIETGTAAQIGDYLAPGVPNLKGYLGVNGAWTESDGTLVKQSGQGNTSHGWDGNGTTKTRFSIDASEKSAMYRDDVTTVQPNAVRYRPMVQLAISASDEAVETCTAVTAQVAALYTHSVIEFQAPTAQNNYTWYRKYADGWVEQGGTTSITSTADGVVATLAVEMADAYYSVTATPVINDNTWIGVWVNRVSATQVKVDMYNTSGSRTRGTCTWEVKGMMTV